MSVKNAAVIIIVAGVMIYFIPLKAETGGGGEDAGDYPGIRSSVKGMKAGPVLLDFGGSVRVRYERYDGFTLKEYGPGIDDDLLLARVRLELAARINDGPRAFLQLQDAHAFLTQYEDNDFPESSPIEDNLDIRQLYLKWLEIGGTAIGFRTGRQQISYGDQRVFGPGSWGNTGRFAWDAAMLKLDSGAIWADLWAGRYLQYRSDIWPNRSLDYFITYVLYGGLKERDYRFDIFYVLENDYSGAVKGESGTGNLLSHTAGFQAEAMALNALDTAATFISQTGKYGRDSIRAFGANVRAGITFPIDWKPRFGGQITWGSGDEDPEDGVHGTFDGVYG